MCKFSIDICIITYKRASRLSRALLSILESSQVMRHNAGIIVIDNDETRSSRETVENISNNYPKLVSYHVEPNKGYASARNKCIEVSKADTIVFIDDDEWVTECWLDNLVKTQKENDAAIVIGPVLSDLPENTPNWIKKGGFFYRERHPTGMKMKYGWSGNALISKKKVCRKELKFDLLYGESGGEDHELFSRLNRNGHLMVWSDEAVVYEEILPEKLHFNWLIKRAFRVGKAVSQVHLSEKERHEKAIWYVKKLAFLFLSVLLVPVWFMGGVGPGIKMISRVVSNAGGLSILGSRSPAP
jgi:succinoglycan biosynthesis protein ExoM